MPTDLADAVATRVATGLYSSASELIREALRLWIRTEQSQLTPAAWPSGVAGDPLTPAGARLRSALELFEREHQAKKPGVSGKNAGPGP